MNEVPNKDHEQNEAELMKKQYDTALTKYSKIKALLIFINTNLMNETTAYSQADSLIFSGDIQKIRNLITESSKIFKETSTFFQTQGKSEMAQSAKTKLQELESGEIKENIQAIELRVESISKKVNIQLKNLKKAEEQKKQIEDKISEISQNFESQKNPQDLNRESLKSLRTSMTQVFLMIEELKSIINTIRPDDLNRYMPEKKKKQAENMPLHLSDLQKKAADLQKNINTKIEVLEQEKIERLEDPGKKLEKKIKALEKKFFKDLEMNTSIINLPAFQEVENLKKEINKFKPNFFNFTYNALSKTKYKELTEEFNNLKANIQELETETTNYNNAVRDYHALSQRIDFIANNLFREDLKIAFAQANQLTRKNNLLCKEILTEINNNQQILNSGAIFFQQHNMPRAAESAKNYDQYYDNLHRFINEDLSSKANDLLQLLKEPLERYQKAQTLISEISANNANIQESINNFYQKLRQGRVNRLKEVLASLEDPLQNNFNALNELKKIIDNDDSMKKLKTYDPKIPNILNKDYSSLDQQFNNLNRELEKAYQALAHNNFNNDRE
ncbi:MAG: hypothetical protein GF332_01810 [Candidatus Moranbacteria bacterium]|nr:hypothetical protein [Candidatus Moranbacteria bacterium]